MKTVGFHFLLITAVIILLNVDLTTPCTAILPSPSTEPQYTGGLRLTGGGNSTYGIVEVSYDNSWGTICNREGLDWHSFQFVSSIFSPQHRNTPDNRTAMTICRLLGLGSGLASATWFTRETLPEDYPLRDSATNRIWLDDFNCRGNERSIDECMHSTPGVFRRECTPLDNLVVICEVTQSNLATETNPSGPEELSCGHTRYDTTSGRVVGGEIARPNQYPWIARLSIAKGGKRYSCAGSIITRSHILTAGHCVLGVTVSEILAYLGDYNSHEHDSGEMVVNVSSWLAHPLYQAGPGDLDAVDYDFALLTLSDNLDFSTWEIQPICLPQNCEAACTATGATVSVAGWGLTAENGTASAFLRTAFVQIGDWSVCNKQYVNTMTDRIICAGVQGGGVDTCQGDSGGPLMTNTKGYYELCGVTSAGFGCARAGYYGLYSNVCSQLTWIKENAGIV